MQKKCQLAEEMISRCEAQDHGQALAAALAQLWERLTIQRHEALDPITQIFWERNYNYVWLKAMIEKAKQVNSTGSTLVTGSSYGVNGILEHHWAKAVNCSSSSQDLYYDFLCAKNVLDSNAGHNFTRCFIIGGYYSPYHDDSKGKQEIELAVSRVFDPIFGDTHNWKKTFQADLWAGLGNLSQEEKIFCEQRAIEKMTAQGTFFSKRKQRGGTIFNLGNRNWWDLSEQERLALGKIRADSHNKLFKHKDTFIENKKILTKYVHFLHENHVLPIFLIAPFAEEYNHFVLKEMKKSVQKLISGISEEIRFVDFNQFNCFEPDDFVDTDHLSEKGAEKFSGLLVELFGK